MKLIRFGSRGVEKPGIETSEGKRIDCSQFGEDWNESFFGNGGIERLQAWLNSNGHNLAEVSDSIRLGSPICRPSKIICVGLNYSLHAKEMGVDLPEQPVLFMKASSSLSGPFDHVIIPKNSVKTDWEVELAVVIGKKASYVSEEDAMDYVAGYTLHNDISERDFQLRHGGQWTKGKSCDTFAPMGPYLVTKDEIQDPHKLSLWLSLNGEMLQDSNTSDLVFNIPKLVSYISQYMSLLPGDVISTGTPAGVGFGLKPARFLKPGDVMELGIEGLGKAKQKAVSYPG